MHSMLISLFTLLAQPHISLAYEVCSPENSFLENLLPAPAPAPNSNLPSICIEAANLSLPATGFYGFCQNDQGQPDRQSIRPCVSEKYVQSTYQTLLDVTDCIEYDSQLAFATFNLESALHLTAVGPALDAGIGQLTRTAINEVNLNAFDQALRKARRSHKASCQRILPQMTKAGASLNERCGFISLPENPVRNLVYAILLLKQNRKTIDAIWKNRHVTLPANIDDDRIRVLLTLLAYNSGPGSIANTFAAYAEQMGTSLTNAHFDFEVFEPENFTTYIFNSFPSNDELVRKRISRYIDYVMRAARRADGLANAGGQCVHPTYFTSPTPPQEPPPIPTPSLKIQTARKLVVEKTLISAKDLVKGLGCKDAQTEFIYNFVPRGSDVDALPSELKRLYNQLCVTPPTKLKP